MGANGAVEGNSIAIPAVGSALFPLGALGPWPYGYYTLLRWVVCISALMVVYRASHVDRPWAVWTFGLVALLFNPLVPIYLSPLVRYGLPSTLLLPFCLWSRS